MDTGNAGQVTVLFRTDSYHLQTQRSNHFEAWYRQMLRNKLE